MANETKNKGRRTKAEQARWEAGKKAAADRSRDRALLNEERRRLSVLVTAVRRGDMKKVADLSAEWEEKDGDAAAQTFVFSARNDLDTAADSLLAEAEAEARDGLSVRTEMVGGLFDLASVADKKVGYVLAGVGEEKPDEDEDEDPKSKGIRAVVSGLSDALSPELAPVLALIAKAGVPLDTSTQLAAVGSYDSDVQASELVRKTLTRLRELCGPEGSELRKALAEYGYVAPKGYHPETVRQALSRFGLEPGATAAQVKDAYDREAAAARPERKLARVEEDMRILQAALQFRGATRKVMIKAQ